MRILFLFGIFLTISASAQLVRVCDQVVGGNGHWCSVKPGGGIACWAPRGEDYEGETEPTAGAERFGTQVDTYAFLSCAIVRGSVECWGVDTYSGKWNEPPPMDRVTDLSVNGTSCAVARGRIQCWGQNQYGLMNIPALNGVNRVRVATSEACASTETQFQCWGRPIDTTDRPADLSGVREFAVASGAVCAILRDETIECWGNHSWWNKNEPKGLVHPRKIAAGYDHVCVIHDGGVKCWGGNRSGQTDVPADLGIPSDLTAKAETTCVTVNQRARCWGQDAW